MPWPSKPYELEAQLRSGWGLVQQGDSALLWHSDKPGPSALSGQESENSGRSFQQRWDQTQGLAHVQNVVFKKQKNSTGEVQMVRKHLKRLALSVSEGSLE